MAGEGAGKARPHRPSVPGATLGMRGGLGKTLLLAFLLLSIFPLSLLAVLTYNQIQRDTRDKLLSSLATVVALKEAHLEDWIETHEGQLALLARGFDPALGREAASASLTSAFEAVEGTGSALTGVVLVDVAGSKASVLVGRMWTEMQLSDPAGDVALLVPSLVAAGDAVNGKIVWVESKGPAGNTLLPAVSYIGHGWALLGLLSPAALQRVVTAQEGFDEGILTSLVARVPETTDVVVVSQETTARLIAGRGCSEAIGQVVLGERGMGAYTDLAGQAVFGAYRWSSRLGVGLVAEKQQAEVLAAGEEVTAWVVAATLGAALLSAAMAAVVTRRVTRPIVELTETAASLARGDLSRRVAVARKDEVGVLARAFNRMAAELRVLYGSLEAKVEERTQAWREANEALEEANKYTRYYVMQLAISAEVARVAASIRDLGTMLETVVELIGRAFELHYVAIYLVDGTGGWAVWQVGTAGIEPAERRVAVGGPTLVGRAASPSAVSAMSDQSAHRGDTSQAQRTESTFPPEAGMSLGERIGGRAEKVVRPDGGWELAIPLCVRDEVLGALVLESLCNDDGQEAAAPISEAGWAPEIDWVVYQSLADQISIAIENARAYALERDTVERLRELDRIQAEFLTNMSHALRTPLNSIIGFSRVMLKELDGPLSAMQHADLETIYEAGRQLLGLVNDMLDLSQLEMGTLSWSPADVDLKEVIEGVMATTHALARNKSIQLRTEVADVLPVLYTDGQRVRQVILALLSNAVKFTDAGTITLRAHVTGPEAARYGESANGVTIGVAIQGTESEPGLASVWWDSVSGERNGRELSSYGVSESGNGQEASAGFGLIVSKRVIERLGGEIWLHQEGSTLEFGLTLPVSAEL